LANDITEYGIGIVPALAGPLTDAIRIAAGARAAD